MCLIPAVKFERRCEMSPTGSFPDLTALTLRLRASIRSAAAAGSGPLCGTTMSLPATFFRTAALRAFLVLVPHADKPEDGPQ